MLDIRNKIPINVRPQIHFTARQNWINDPNGFSYYNGLYHLFYQYNPKGITWGNMSWGHAVSKDLINWDELEVAMIPDKPYDIDGVFSGSAITLKDIHHLYYTGVLKETEGYRQVQCIATSTNGINYTKSSLNPVLTADENADEYDFRDPKMWIYENQVYMIIATKKDGHGKAIVYKSKDGYNFEYLKEFTKENTGFMWECPDLFQLQDQWALIFSAMEVEDYPAENVAFIAPVDFDYESSKTKVYEYELMDYSADYYAPQSMVDNKGRRVVIGWLRMSEPISKESVWVGMMTLPREIHYNSEVGFSYQVIDEVFEDKKAIVNNELATDNCKKNNSSPAQTKTYKLVDNKAYELKITFSNNNHIKISNGQEGGLLITYNPVSKEVEVTRLVLKSITDKQDDKLSNTKYSYKTDSFNSPKIQTDTISMQVIIDQSVAEIFINDGKYVISVVFSNQNIMNFLEIENQELLMDFELFELKG